MKRFSSKYANRLANYVALRRSLGLKFSNQESILHAFDRFLISDGNDGPITQELALRFASADPLASDKRCARYYQIVRNFSDYLATFEPHTPRLDPRALHAVRRRSPAYIFSESELEQLLALAQTVSAKNPIRGATLHAMIGLAASTGLRIGEVIRLDRKDVDLQSGVLTIICTKFYKDRMVIVHPTTLDVLRDYEALRDLTYPHCDSQAFFINTRRCRFAQHTLRLDFWRMLCQMGIREARGSGPSFHDLRHTFAVRRLVSWYREGADVQAMLPILATHLGHAHYSDTAYYLTATAELLGLAADRFHRALQIEEVIS